MFEKLKKAGSKIAGGIGEAVDEITHSDKDDMVVYIATLEEQVEQLEDTNADLNQQLSLGRTVVRRVMERCVISGPDKVPFCQYCGENMSHNDSVVKENHLPNCAVINAIEFVGV